MAPAMARPELAPRLRRLVSENAHRALANPLLQHSPEPPPAGRLAEIKAPTLLILGEKDVPYIHAAVAALEKGIVGARKVVVPGAGHIVNMEEPEAFDRALAEFLAGLP